MAGLRLDGSGTRREVPAGGLDAEPPLLACPGPGFGAQALGRKPEAAGHYAQLLPLFPKTDKALRDAARAAGCQFK